MNKINFEFFKNVAEVSEESYDGSEELSLHFAGAGEGYLSVGPRIIKVEGGKASFSLGSFSEGIHGCYLMLDGQRYELPSLERTQRQIRMVESTVRAERARVKYLKDLEARILALEADMARANERIFGKKGII
ncbi:MAG: hypothetical protein IJV74_04040 [Clostridia bacterium]|nr:hypothetical protein [Clostridia bacterium]